MRYVSIPGYYLGSVISLLASFNWWVFPLLFLKKPVLIKINNKWEYYVNSYIEIWTLKEVIVDRQYEYMNNLQHGDTVIDIGAAIGEFSIYASDKAEKVIAYEVNRERAESMAKNMAVNGVKNVELRHERAVSLKEIMSGLDKCDFLKVDCEGCEYSIFKDADSSVLDRIVSVAMEVHLYNDDMRKNCAEIVELLRDNGFSVIEKPNEVHDYLMFVYASKNEQCRQQ